MADRGHAVAAAVALAAFLFAYLWLQDGPLLVPPQGKECILAAGSLMEGRGFERSPGVPFGRFGPLYPLTLSLLARAGLDVIPAVYLVNCATFALALFAFYALSRTLQIRWIWLALAFFGTLAPNVYLLRGARPDGIPICMSLWVLVGLVRYARNRSPWILVATALACCVATTARYMAIFTLLPVAVAAVWYFGRTRAESARRAALFLAVSATPVAVWLVRNVLATGHAFGMPRTAPRVSFAETSFPNNLWGLVRTVQLDLFGHHALGMRPLIYGAEPVPLAAVVTATTMTAIAILIAVCWLGRDRLRSCPARRREGPPDVVRGVVLVSAYGFVYVVALLVLWTVGNNDPIYTRFAAPLYPCLVLFGFRLATVVSPRGASPWPAIALAVVALSITVANLPKSVALLGDEPGANLMEVQGPRQQGEGRWKTGVGWDGTTETKSYDGP